MLETREIEGKIVNVETANKEYMIFMKGKKPEEGDLKDSLLSMFETYGDVTIGEIQFNSDNKEFFTSARLSTEEKAKSFIKYFN